MVNRMEIIQSENTLTINSTDAYINPLMIYTAINDDSIMREEVIGDDFQTFYIFDKDKARIVNINFTGYFYIGDDQNLAMEYCGVNGENKLTITGKFLNIYQCMIWSNYGCVTGQYPGDTIIEVDFLKMLEGCLRGGKNHFVNIKKGYYTSMSSVGDCQSGVSMYYVFDNDELPNSNEESVEYELIYGGISMNSFQDEAPYKSINALTTDKLWVVGDTGVPLIFDNNTEPKVYHEPAPTGNTYLLPIEGTIEVQAITGVVRK
jgi:hypothetical protein